MKNDMLAQAKAPYWYVNGSHHNGRSYSTEQNTLGTKCAWCAAHGDEKEATDHFIVGDHQVDLCNWCYNQAKSGLLHLRIGTKNTVWGSEVKTSSDKHVDYILVMSSSDPAQRVGKCSFCGQTFTYEGKHKTFCSRQHERWYRADKLPKKAKSGICEICGKDFVYFSRIKRTCSNECRRKLMIRTHEANDKYVTSTCRICGREFEAKVTINGTYKKLCSEKCENEMLTNSNAKIYRRYMTSG